MASPCARSFGHFRRGLWPSGFHKWRRMRTAGGLESDNTMTTTNTREELRPLVQLMHPKFNPRAEGHYRALAELRESLRAVGQQDALHVWRSPTGEEFVLKGNRRLVAMRELGWMECRQIVHDFEREEEAYLYLLQDHGHTDPLDAREKMIAARNAYQLGCATEKIAGALGVGEERVQLWFALEEQLSPRAKDAIGAGDLSMTAAEMLLGVEKGEQERALQLLLCDPTSGEPLTGAAARALLEAQFIQPARWRREWEERAITLRKRLRVAAGYFFVEWPDREEYVQGVSGEPQPAFARAEDLVPRDPAGQSFGDKALARGVPVYVVPAPRDREGFVRVVNRRMLADAVDAQETAQDGDAQKRTTEARENLAPDSCGARVKAPAREDELVIQRRALLGAISDVLIETPARVMTGEPWSRLLPFLASRAGGGAFVAWQGSAAPLAKAMEDKRQRAAMRWALLFLLCMESDASDQPLAVLREVAAGLGVLKKTEAAIKKALR